MWWHVPPIPDHLCSKDSTYLEWMPFLTSILEEQPAYSLTKACYKGLGIARKTPPSMHPWIWPNEIIFHQPRFPWNLRRFPLLNHHHLGWKLVWGRYNLTRFLAWKIKDFHQHTSDLLNTSKKNRDGEPFLPCLFTHLKFNIAPENPFFLARFACGGDERSQHQCVRKEDGLPWRMDTWFMTMVSLSLLSRVIPLPNGLHSCNLT